jgi:hypothetical protein
MEHWGFTDEVKEAARRRRRLENKQAVREQSAEPDEAESDQQSQQ